MAWKQQSRLLSRADKQKRKQQALLHLPCGIKVHSSILLCIVIAALVPLLMLYTFHHQHQHQHQDSSSFQDLNQKIDIPPENQENKDTIIHPNDDDDNSVTFHFIVSSECSSYQLWETITQLHSAEAVRQCGRFTWIISGCLPNDRLQEGIGKSGAKSDLLTPEVIQQHVDRHFPPPSSANLQDCSRLKPELHFTPDYSDMSVYGGPFADGKKKRIYRNPKNGKETGSSYGNRYVFNNKPNGLLHWAKEHATENLDHTNEAIVLIDPDFLFLARFHLVRPDLTVVGNRNLNQALRQDPKESSLRDSDLVKPGQPAAASYGLGAQWLEFENLHQICGRDSHCTNTTPQDVHKYYSAGPPYVIHRADVLALATKWASLVPATYDEYPLLYAEMYAYSMAAAHLQLKHNLLNGLFTGCMVGWPNPSRWSDPKMKDGESGAVRESAKLYRSHLEDELATVIADTTSTTEDTNINDTGGVVQVQQQQPQKEQGPASCFLDPIRPPPMLHYCNRYMIEATDKMRRLSGQEDVRYRFFAKRAVTHNAVLRHCDDRHRFVPFTSIKDSEKMANGNSDWNTLAVCAIIRALNFARHEGCHRGGATIGDGGE